MKTPRAMPTYLALFSAFACSGDPDPGTPNSRGSQGGQTGQAAQSGAAGGSVAGASGDASGGIPSEGRGGAPTLMLPTAGAAGEENCGVQDFDRERKPAEVILVLDRSGSMEDPPAGGTIDKWSMVLPPLEKAITSTDSAISWGLKLYPELDEAEGCAPETIVPAIHAPIDVKNAAQVIAAIDATLPLGDGTPTGDGIRFALAHLRERAELNDNPKFILLATDGDPTCSGGGGSALEYAVSQISEALAAGFPTFVVGVDTIKESSIENLNEMAEAGGKARPRTDFHPLASHTSFYLTSTAAELEQVMAGITGELASCIFELNPPPPVPDNIAVDFADARADHDPTQQDGWDYTKPDYTEIQVFGSWCKRIQTEAMNKVNIKYGCPNQPIPR